MKRWEWTQWKAKGKKKEKSIKPFDAMDTVSQCTF